MQENGFYLPLKRSKYLLIYSQLVHILTVISVSLLAVSLMIKILLVIVIFISQVLHIYRLGFIGKHKKRPIALLNRNKEYWQIRYADNSLTSDLMLESAWITRFAVIIHFKSSNKQRQSLLIFKDVVDKEPLRQLRVQLRLAFFQQ